MKTIIDLLIRLQQLRLCSQRAAHNTQLTEREKNSLRSAKKLVRDCLPPRVRLHYDGLKRKEPELLKCPEVFAMAVLVSAYRSLSSRQRRKLLSGPVAMPIIGRHRHGCRTAVVQHPHARKTPGGRRRIQSL